MDEKQASPPSSTLACNNKLKITLFMVRVKKDKRTKKSTKNGRWKTTSNENQIRIRFRIKVKIDRAEKIEKLLLNSKTFSIIRRLESKKHLP